MDIMHIFDEIVEIPQIKSKAEFQAVVSDMQMVPNEHINKAIEVFSEIFPLSIKKLITMIELSRQPMPGQSAKSPDAVLTDFRKLYAKLISND